MDTLNSNNAKSKIELIRADITTLRVDAIVNAANRSLMGGGGVDAAIHRAGGPAILQACFDHVSVHGECGVGETVLTTAGKLAAKAVIHTVGPYWLGGDQGEAEYLAKCYSNSLSLAAQHQYSSIAFPAISTGIYGYPEELAAQLALTTVRDFLLQPSSIERVMMVSFSAESFELMQVAYNLL